MKVFKCRWTNSRYTCNPQCQTSEQRYSSARSSNGTKLNVSFYFWPWDGVLNLMSCIRSQCAPISLYGFPCIDFNHVSVILLVTSVPHHKATNHYYYIVFVFLGGGWYLWLISQLAPCVSLKFTQFTLYMLFFHLSTSCFLLFYMHKVNVSKNLKDYNELNAPVTLSQGVLRSQNGFFSFLQSTWIFHQKNKCYVTIFSDVVIKLSSVCSHFLYVNDRCT